MASFANESTSMKFSLTVDDAKKDGLKGFSKRRQLTPVSRQRHIAPLPTADDR